MPMVLVWHPHGFGMAWEGHGGGIRVPLGLHQGSIRVASGFHWGCIGVELGFTPPLSYHSPLTVSPLSLHSPTTRLSGMILTEVSKEDPDGVIGREGKRTSSFSVCM